MPSDRGLSSGKIVRYTSGRSSTVTTAPATGPNPIGAPARRPCAKYAMIAATCASALPSSTSVSPLCPPGKYVGMRVPVRMLDGLVIHLRR